MARSKRHAKPSLPSSRTGSLEVLETPILNNRGARYEGDIFSTLQHSSYALRSWEFALADGAIYCNGSFDWGASFADRFSAIEQAEGEAKLILFDVKSKISQEAGDQIYATTTRQEHNVAFYIGICAADTSFVELIPNIYQQASSTPFESDLEDSPAPKNRQLGVNPSRESKLQPASYKLDPEMSPYRMPLLLLAEAIRRVRRCAQAMVPYVNPWTLVSFPNWKPFTTHSTDLLIPAQDSQHFTAYKAALDICRMIKIQRGPVAIDFDFIGLQPRLADFKFITALPQNPFSHLNIRQQRLDGRPLRQDFIQHKLDGKDRARSSRLSKVAIARGEGKERRWYFSTFDRFDFLFYQFSFSNLPDPRRHTVFFFIPEHEIPDIFYETHEIEVDFEEYPNLALYRIVMDNEGHWVQQVLRIIMENPQPRKAASRPLRTAISSDASLDLAISQVSTSSGPAKKISSGRGLYTDVLTRCHRHFYRNLMEHCARRQSGLIVFLGTENPMGDFGLLRYHWTQLEQQEYIRSGIPPKTVNDLPAHTPIVPVYYYVKDLECDFRGPNVTAAQFRRLNSCRNHRLVVWNLWGPDEPDQLRPLIVIPSEDLRPVHEQRALFKRNLEMENNDGKFAERTPLVSALLSTGLLASDYKIQSQGPLEYDDGSNWGQVWRFFEQFLDHSSQDSQLQNPKGKMRNGTLYRCSLRKIHSRAVKEHAIFSI